MSDTKTIIEVSPPKIIVPTLSMVVGISCQETFQSYGHQCSYCNGNGYFWGEDESGETVKKECPVCKGSGKLNAEITVEWSPMK